MHSNWYFCVHILPISVHRVPLDDEQINCSKHVDVFNLINGKQTLHLVGPDILIF
jgi:hypothetical protein